MSSSVFRTLLSLMTLLIVFIGFAGILLPRTTEVDRILSARNVCEVLRIRRGLVQPSHVKEQHRAIARLVHPDKNGDHRAQQASLRLGAARSRLLAEGTCELDAADGLESFPNTARAEQEAYYQLLLMLLVVGSLFPAVRIQSASCWNFECREDRDRR